MRTSRMWTWRAVLVCSSCAAALNCGGDSEPGVSSGLPEDTSVATLSEPDAVQLCEAIASASEDAFNVNELCTFFAAIATITATETEELTIDQAMCEETRDACVADGSLMPMSECTPESASSSLATCTATVGQVEDCLSAQLSLLADVLDIISCTRAPTMQDAQRFENFAEPAACTTLPSTCDDLVVSPDMEGVPVDPTNPTEPTEPTGPTEPPSPTGCDDTCFFANDDECDDGGPDSVTNFCGLGTDCTDCGQR
jgi:hypothetical protein